MSRSCFGFIADALVTVEAPSSYDRCSGTKGLKPWPCSLSSSEGLGLLEGRKAGLLVLEGFLTLEDDDVVTATRVKLDEVVGDVPLDVDDVDVDDVGGVPLEDDTVDDVVVEDVSGRTVPGANRAARTGCNVDGDVVVVTDVDVVD